MDEHEKFMRKAISLTIQNIERGGGPFGAVIVKDGRIVATGVNRVTAVNDPTAHAEISAIRKAAKKLGTFSLEGCTLYTSCEPCPMCLGAVYWAHFDRLFYANTKSDAKKIGFDDSFIYDEIELNLSERSIKTVRLLPEEAIRAFEFWNEKDDKIEY